MTIAYDDPSLGADVARLAVGRAPSAVDPRVGERRSAEVLATTLGTVVRCSMTALAPDVPDTDPVVTGGLPTALLRLEPGEWAAHWFVSDWGDEFTPGEAAVAAGSRWESRTGRSSKGTHPWVLFERAGFGSVLVCPAWSGNWMVTAEPGADGAVRVAAGISDWKFSRALSSSRHFRAPEVYVETGSERWEAAAALAEEIGRASWRERV